MFTCHDHFPIDIAKDNIKLQVYSGGILLLKIVHTFPFEGVVKLEPQLFVSLSRVQLV